ncbi:MAG: hypothetical protein ACLQFI_02910 [Methylocella sp.]
MSNLNQGDSTPLSPSISTESPRGATIRTAYVEREVKAYAVFEHEVRTISMWNTLAGVFSAFGAASLSFAIGIYTNASFAEKLTAEGIVMLHFVAPALGVIAVLSWSLAVWAIYSRRGTWTAIRTESKQTRSD